MQTNIIVEHIVKFLVGQKDLLNKKVTEKDLINILVGKPKCYMVLCIDTIGLVKRINYNDLPSYKEFHKYDSARIIKIEWLIKEESTHKIIESYSSLVVPDGFDPEKGEGYSYHHIKKIDAMKGEKITTILNKLNEKLTRISHIVSNDISFVCNCIQSEMVRYSIDESKMTNIDKYCVKEKSKQFNRDRWMNLADFYKRLTGNKECEKISMVAECFIKLDERSINLQDDYYNYDYCNPLFHCPFYINGY